MLGVLPYTPEGLAVPADAAGNASSVYICLSQRGSVLLVRRRFWSPWNRDRPAVSVVGRPGRRLRARSIRVRRGCYCTEALFDVISTSPATRPGRGGRPISIPWAPKATSDEQNRPTLRQANINRGSVAGGIGGHGDPLWCVGEDAEQSPALQRQQRRRRRQRHRLPNLPRLRYRTKP